VADVEPISWRAIQEIADLVRQITVAGGYYTDLGAGLIVTDRSQVSERLAQPIVLIAADTIARNEDSSSHRTISSDMDVTIEYVLPMDGVTNPELLAHRGRADLVRALTTDLRGAERCMRSVTITETLIGAATDPRFPAVIVAQVQATVGLTETKSRYTT
jgi:hypothetical protein